MAHSLGPPNKLAACRVAGLNGAHSGRQAAAEDLALAASVASRKQV